MIGHAPRPSGPWGRAPLTELTVAVALVLAAAALASWGTPTGIRFAAAATAIGCLAGLELALREHFAGYRSHCLLLAGVAASASAVLVGFVSDGFVAPGVAFGGVFVASACRLRRGFLASAPRI